MRLEPGRLAFAREVGAAFLPEFYSAAERPAFQIIFNTSTFPSAFRFANLGPSIMLGHHAELLPVVPRLAQFAFGLRDLGSVAGLRRYGWGGCGLGWRRSLGEEENDYPV